MPQPVKLSDSLVQAARDVAPDADRSIAGQIEHWARLGRAAESRLSVDEAVRWKRGEWASAIREPAMPLADDAGGTSWRTAEGVQHRAIARPRPLHRGAPPGPSAGFPDWLERQREPIQEICRNCGVRRLAFFGSVLRTDFDPAAGGSDVDATVVFGAATGLPTARQYFDFKSALERQLQRAVDLVELDAMPDTRLKRIIVRDQRPFHVEAA